MFNTVVFDAYGTLFDVHSVAELGEQLFPGHGAALWRDKQIEYTRLVTLSDPDAGGSRFYQPFQELTLAGLRYACRRLGLELTSGKETALMARYSNLAAFPDAAPALRAIKVMGFATAILSNGNPSMLDAVVASAGLADALDEVISVDQVRQFKTSLLTYALIEQRMKTPHEKVLFVSSNAWDALGASWQGLRVFWVNRAKLPFEEIGPRPWATGASLADLPPLLAAR